MYPNHDDGARYLISEADRLFGIVEPYEHDDDAKDTCPHLSRAMTYLAQRQRLAIPCLPVTTPEEKKLYYELLDAEVHSSSPRKNNSLLVFLKGEFEKKALLAAQCATKDEPPRVFNKTISQLAR
jgi:hypothetical protein